VTEKEPEMTLSVTKNATCIACGCVCDDIELHSETDRIVRAGRACALGRSWFFSHTDEHLYPDALIDGEPATVDAAVSASAELLRKATFPLIFGLGNSTCEAQREAVFLTELIGGVIDSHTSLTHGTNKIAAQLVGKVSCTLGEVRYRADLVIYWGTNPVESHPRHFTRYTLSPRGKFIPGGRKDRTMVLIDVRKTRTANAANLFLQIHPGKDFEVLTSLRALIRNRTVDEDLVAETGLTVQQLRNLVDRMKRARYGVIFFGSGLSGTRGKHMNAAAILALTTDLNAFTKFAAVPMRDHGNETGADNVLCWTTGHPIGVDFSRGYPRSNPGEFTAVDLLVRREVDAALIVGNGPWALLPQAAINHLARIPTIVLDSRITEMSRLVRIHATTAPTGISTSGTVYRMDKVPLPLRSVLHSPYPTEEDLIIRIRRAVKEPCGG
jgi:formylmethanofuran dehydrogenase subunit B